LGKHGENVFGVDIVFVHYQHAINSCRYRKFSYKTIYLGLGRILGRVLFYLSERVWL